MNAPPIGTPVLLCNGQPRPKRGRWVIASWMVENGRGTVEEIGPDYFCVKIETRADGSPVGYQRTQVIHNTDKRFTVTPL
jgi:hypothetical protein